MSRPGPSSLSPGLSGGDGPQPRAGRPGGCRGGGRARAVRDVGAARPAHPASGRLPDRRHPDRTARARPDRHRQHRAAVPHRARLPLPDRRLRTQPPAALGPARQARGPRLADVGRDRRRGGRRAGRGRLHPGLRAGGAGADHHRARHAAADPARQPDARRRAGAERARRGHRRGTVPHPDHRGLPHPAGPLRRARLGGPGRGARPRPVRAAVAGPQPRGAAGHPGGPGRHRADDAALDRARAARPAHHREQVRPGRRARRPAGRAGAARLDAPDEHRRRGPPSASSTRSATASSSPSSSSPRG